MKIKYQIVGISFYFFLKRHTSRHFPILTIIAGVFYRYTVKPYKISAVVSLQLLYVHQESLKLSNRNVLILVKQKRAIVYTGLEDFIPSLVVSHRVQLV